MALGGGTFITQNKVLPGAYINFVSVASASATLSDRGVVTMPLELDWGVDGEIFEVEARDFQKNSTKFFGHAYTDDEMKGLRDLFKYASKLYAYKLNSGGTKASCTFATAKYPGTRGNDLKIVIQANVDDPTQFDCYTYMGTDCVDEQTVSSASGLVDNDYVDFKQDATLIVTAPHRLPEVQMVRYPVRPIGLILIRLRATTSTLWAWLLQKQLSNRCLLLSVSVCGMIWA